MDRAPWRQRATSALAGVASTSAWRTIAAFAAGTLTVAATSGGLFLYWPEAQAALLSGVCVALIAPSRRSAVIAAFAAALLGRLFGPLSVWSDPVPFGTAAMYAAGTAVLAGVVALGARAALAAVPTAGRWLAWATIGVIVANVWVTGIAAANAAPVDDDGNVRAPLVQVLAGSDAVGKDVLLSDQFAYLKVVRALKAGRPFYRTWSEELGTTRTPGQSAGVVVLPGMSAGASVVNYHLPTPFLFWAALPGSPVSIVYAYLFLVSLAVVAAPFVTRGTVRLPLSVPGAAAVATYLFTYSYSTIMLQAEQWAGALCVLAVAAWARSTVSTRWKAWTVIAAALGVLSALFREPAVLVPLAGLVSAFLVRADQRRFRATAWGAGLAVFAGVYLVHYLNVRPWLSGPSVGAAFRFAGLDSVISALTYGTPTLGSSGTLPMLLAAAGILGIVLTRDPRLRAFAGIAVASSLFAYMFVSNNALEVGTGTVVNYWGAVIVPTMYAFCPAALAVLPGMSPAVRR